MPQELADGTIRDALIIRATVALQHRHGPRRKPLPAGGEEPRFADPRLPDQPHHLPLPGQGASQEVVENRELPLPA